MLYSVSNRRGREVKRHFMLKMFSPSFVNTNKVKQASLTLNRQNSNI